MTKLFRYLAIVLVVAGCAATLSAQAIQGSTAGLYGKVTDEQGGPLPGVTVTLSGVGAPRTTTTDATGSFRFINISPGTYSVKSELSGLTTVERTNVAIALGSNVELTIPMKLTSVAATVTVTSEAPLLDSRRDREGSNFSQEELKTIPTSRDPWGVLQQTASVQLDNVNVGSNSSGQQSVFIGKGTNFTNNAWNIDGVAMTDLSAVGASPAYYDFDSFQEMQMTTGGADPSIVTPGVTVNLITKRGTNDVHGSGRVFDTPHETEAFNIPEEAKEQGLTSTNRIDNVQDYGIEVGGPIWRDKAWAWGSFGRTDLKIITATGNPDNTLIEDLGAKINLQPIESNSFTAFYFRGDKRKQGRLPGQTSQFPNETRWNQTGPSHVAKMDDSQVFSSNLFATLVYSYANTPFNLDPIGGDQEVYRDAINRAYHGSYYIDHNTRPQHQVQGTVTTFFNTGSLSHEIKLGAAHIDFQQAHTRRFPGTGTYGDELVIATNDPNFPMRAFVNRDVSEGEKLKTTGGFIGDTITTGNLTMNLGIRYDQGSGSNLATSVPDSFLPEILPGVNFAGGGEEFKAKAWQPRVGVTYGFGAQKNTLFRASYARYADQIGTSNIGADNPTGLPIPRAIVQWNDANGDHFVTRDELCLTCPIGAQNYDPTNPTAAISPNRIDHSLHPPKTDEVIVGVDHQILPELVAGVSYTYRHRTDLIWNCPLALDNSAGCVSRNDYSLINNGVEGFDRNGNSVGFSDPLYGLTNVPDTYTFGTFETNRDGYATNYNGVEFQVTKRLSNKWMAHGSVTLSSWKQKVDNLATGCIDPTNQVGTFAGNFESLNGRGNSCADGDIAYDYNGVSWINAKWQAAASALYQLPWNFTVSGAFFGRQGYPSPYFVTQDANDGLGPRDVALGKADAHRLKNVYQLDLGLQKVMPIGGKADVTLTLDVFNVFNANTILFRESNASDGGPLGDPPAPQHSGTVGTIDTIQNPRVLRFGARVSF